MATMQTKAEAVLTQVTKLLAEGKPHSTIRQQLDISAKVFDLVLVLIGKGFTLPPEKPVVPPVAAKPVVPPVAVPVKIDLVLAKKVSAYYGNHTGSETMKRFRISPRVFKLALDLTGTPMRKSGTRPDRPRWHREVIEAVALTRNMREAAKMMGITHQRVAQIVKVEGKSAKELRDDKTG